MLRQLIATADDVGPTIARVALGLVITPHGMQKLFGRFGGYDFAGTMHYFTDTIGAPWILGFLAIMAEFFGGIGLVVGLLSCAAALGVSATLATAVLTVHVQYGFFGNWLGNQQGEGVEYFILGVALGPLVMVKGSGAYSLDGLLSRPAATSQRQRPRLPKAA